MARPKVDETERRSKTLTLRVTPELRRKLEKAAAEHAVSVSQEVEQRLLKTFAAPFKPRRRKKARN